MVSLSCFHNFHTQCDTFPLCDCSCHDEQARTMLAELQAGKLKRPSHSQYESPEWRCEYQNNYYHRTKKQVPCSHNCGRMVFVSYKKKNKIPQCRWCAQKARRSGEGRFGVAARRRMKQ